MPNVPKDLVEALVSEPIVGELAALHHLSFLQSGGNCFDVLVAEFLALQI